MTQLATTGRTTGYALPTSAITALDLGAMETDAGYYLRGRNASTLANPNPVHERRELVLVSVAINHPEVGLILFDAGLPPEEELHDRSPEAAFALTRHEEHHKLPNALAAAGYALHDVKAIVLSHLHIDHSGGIRHFLGTDVPIYLHERELQYGPFAAATGQDGSYQPEALSFDLNWQPVSGDAVELFPGIELHHLPGHTPGLSGLVVERQDAHPLFFVGDHYPYPDSIGAYAQGWVTRDDVAWHQTSRKVDRIVTNRGAEIIHSHHAPSRERVNELAAS